MRLYRAFAMNRQSRTALLFLVIVIEGYVVLATELIAIRQLVPFVGSGTEIIAIIISAVLLPLAIGYHVGGSQRVGIRKRLLRNILIALCILTFGLSYVFLELFFGALMALGIDDQIVQAAIYAVFFLSIPVFKLGQTVPLISNYFDRTRLSEITGQMLFFSTVGSFLGSVFSTLVLMNTIGVHGTVIVTCTLLVLLVPCLSKRLISPAALKAVLLLLIALSLNNASLMRALHIVSNNRYNMISVSTDPMSGARIMRINRSPSSGIAADGSRTFQYIQYIEKIFIAPIAKPGNVPRDMLVLGAGGFTVGLDDAVNHYTFVDIDPDLKSVAEREFLKKPLGPNKHFEPGSARAFLRRDQAKYDFILVDTFTHIISAPMETTTEEFLGDVKKRLKPGGIVVVNQPSFPDFSSRFDGRYDRVFAKHFPLYTRQVLGDYDPWVKTPGRAQIRNILYIYYDRPYNTDRESYTDDRNTYSLDRR